MFPEATKLQFYIIPQDSLGYMNDDFESVVEFFEKSRNNSN
jgi:hypothetical protein